MRLPDGTTATARRNSDGSFDVVDQATAESQEPSQRSEAVEEGVSPHLTESSYRELMAVLAMEDTGRSRRGSL
ncbi:hypothetical protein DVB87_10675 [Tsukamurella tyrosinosolvens]|nr:hypothetical protein DVB87_10675 [Tsukamurella tyrosinosolvens]